LGPIVHAIARTLFRAGGVGLLALGILDSSPVVIPLGNDLLVLALSARHHPRVFYYVAMATVGSILGCLITDWISRKSEKGLKKFVSGRRLAYVKQQVQKRAALTLVAAALLPPPFPFTAVVAGAAAFKYPRSKLLGFISIGRLTRFAIEGALAVHYGRWIIEQARSSWLEHVMIALIVIMILATAVSIYRWSGRSAAFDQMRKHPVSARET
jgi:membrane protein YqaA with SNARE-associated domain